MKGNKSQEARMAYIPTARITGSFETTEEEKKKNDQDALYLLKKYKIIEEDATVEDTFYKQSED